MAADGIGLMDLASAMARRGVSIAPESALFIALLVAEALRDAPGAVAVESVRITGEGGIDLPPRRGAPDERAAVASIVAVCEAVLHPPSAQLRGVIERVRAGSVATVESLRAELESLLVPLNRGAAKRVLGRFAREHLRTAAAPSPAPSPASAPATSPATAPKPKPAPEPEPDHAPSAVDTAPDRVPAHQSPPAVAPAPLRSAIDTEPDAAAGITALLAHPVLGVSDDGISHPVLLNPEIPRPASLGTLGSLPGASGSFGAIDPEPEAHLGRSRLRTEDEPSATDTAIDGGLRSDALATIGDTDDAYPRGGVPPTRRRKGSGVVLAMALGSLFVALAVLAFAMMRR